MKAIVIFYWLFSSLVILEASWDSEARIPTKIFLPFGCFLLGWLAFPVRLIQIFRSC